MVTFDFLFQGDLVHVKELKGKGFEMKSKVLNVVKTVRNLIIQ